MRRTGRLSPSRSERSTSASTVDALTAPEDRRARRAPSRSTVRVTGGAGPVVGVALVDAAHRWYARPIVVGRLRRAWRRRTIEGPRRPAPQVDWLSKRPGGARAQPLVRERHRRIASDSAAKQWASARVTFHLRAPDRPGSYPLTAAYFYGTEKSRRCSVTPRPRSAGRKSAAVSGGGSGRVMFAPVAVRSSWSLPAEAERVVLS